MAISELVFRDGRAADRPSHAIRVDDCNLAGRRQSAIVVRQLPAWLVVNLDKSVGRGSVHKSNNPAKLVFADFGAH